MLSDGLSSSFDEPDPPAYRLEAVVAGDVGVALAQAVQLVEGDGAAREGAHDVGFGAQHG